VCWWRKYRRDKLFSLGADNALLGFVMSSTPQLLETTSDSREMINVRLKEVCARYIEAAAQPIRGQ
jgi:hypothetical protein